MTRRCPDDATSVPSRERSRFTANGAILQRKRESGSAACLLNEQQCESCDPLAVVVACLGVDGLFCETHPDPDRSPSDGANMVPLAEIETLMRRLLAIRAAAIQPSEASRV